MPVQTTEYREDDIILRNLSFNAVNCAFIYGSDAKDPQSGCWSMHFCWLFLHPRIRRRWGRCCWNTTFCSAGTKNRTCRGGPFWTRGFSLSVKILISNLAVYFLITWTLWCGVMQLAKLIPDEWGRLTARAIVWEPVPLSIKAPA